MTFLVKCIEMAFIISCGLMIFKLNCLAKMIIFIFKTKRGSLKAGDPVAECEVMAWWYYLVLVFCCRMDCCVSPNRWNYEKRTMKVEMEVNHHLKLNLNNKLSHQADNDPNHAAKCVSKLVKDNKCDT